MLTYRPNRTGTLLAAYLGACRVGYVEARRYDGWRWQLSLVHPAGGNYFGIHDTEDEARDSVERALTHWLDSAGLEIKDEHQGIEPRFRRGTKAIEERPHGRTVGTVDSGGGSVAAGVPRRSQKNRGRAGKAGGK